MSKKRQHKPDDMKHPDPDLLSLLDRGAEPWWMQDIRLAQRRIEAERARLRAAQSSDSSEALDPLSPDC